MENQVWDYLVDKVEDMTRLEAALDVHGRQGWELVELVHLGRIFFVMKRLLLVDAPKRAQ